MNLRQLRYIHEVTRSGYNISAAAEKLHTSQPGVSKQIRLLEEELGIDIFVRNGKHLTSTTRAGAEIIKIAERMLLESENVYRAAAEALHGNRGSLTIATTHTQARYALPDIIRKFRSRYDKVSLTLHQGSPPQIAAWAAHGEADFAIATEAMEHYSELIMLPCYHWNRCILVPRNHALTKLIRLTHADVAKYPLVTYTFGFTGRSVLDAAFKARGLNPEVVLTAVDADVIKTYVRLGLGIGIVANMAYDDAVDGDLVRLDASGLFPHSTTHIGFRRGSFIRDYMYEFIHTFAPHLTPEVVRQAEQLSPGAEMERLLTQLSDALPMY